jgi:hypothetical protein
MYIAGSLPSMLERSIKHPFSRRACESDRSVRPMSISALHPGSPSLHSVICPGSEERPKHW